MGKPENVIQRAVMQLLKRCDIPYWRMNSGSQISYYKGRRHIIRGHEPGTADIEATPTLPHAKDAVVLWIECKSAKGKQTVLQKQFEEFVTANHMFYLLCYDPNQLWTWLQEHGFK